MQNAEAAPTEDRLARNFHRTFIPERRYLNAMLRFAAGGRTGDYQEIAAATGIPMGESTGKVPAILDYCRGMGLLYLVKSERPGERRPDLTLFGRIVLEEDPFLKEEVTQWIAHLNLCNRFKGAEAWFMTFCEGRRSLGLSFSRQQLDDYLALAFSAPEGRLIGPLIRMYEEEAAFCTCGALSEAHGMIQRKAAPLKNQLARGYGAWLLGMMADVSPASRQVSLRELDESCGCFRTAGWSDRETDDALRLMESRGVLAVDRHMDPWLLSPRMSADAAWRSIYDDMI